MLTANEFDSTATHRIRIVQEVVADGTHLDRAIELAYVISRQAPSVCKPPCAAREPQLVPAAVKPFGTEDARIGNKSISPANPPNSSAAEPNRIGQLAPTPMTHAMPGESHRPAST